MIRYLSILALMSGTLAFATPAFAQTSAVPASVPITCPAGETWSTSFETCVPTAVSSAVGNAGGTIPTPTAQGLNVGAGNTGDPSTTFGWLLGGIMSLFATLMGYAGVILNDAVYVTVLQMGSFVNQLSAVGVVWHVMRDLGNIVLIFGFIAVGICYILGVSWYGGGTKMIPTLLLAAVLINFSLFASEAVIDVGNIFASQFYTQINGDNPPKFINTMSITGGGATYQAVSHEGISNVIMGSIGLQTLFGAFQTKDLGSGQIMLIGFLGIILFIIAAFVMFSLAFILIARFVTLIFLIIVAPIGFAGLAVPKLEEYAKKWWGMLIKNTISAPILLLMLYVALAVITDAKFLTGFNAQSNGWTQLASTQGPADVGSFAGIFLSFLVAMGLLLACTYLANSMSVTGASWATKWAGKMSFGAVAYGMSGVVGGLARGTRWGAQRYAPNSKIARTVARGARFVENRKFDMRSIPGVGAGLTAVGAAGAAAPVKSSIVQTAQKVGKWYKGEEEKKIYDQETRIPRLKAALARGAPGAADVRKIMRTITDDEMKKSDIQSLIRTNPLAVESLTNHQVTLLPDSLLTTANVYQNLTIGQFEAYRAAGNVAPGVAGDPMQLHIAANQYGPAYLPFRTNSDQATIKAFWHIP